MSKLVKLCPCCNGKAVWVEIKSKDILLWQLACNQCGMATNAEETRSNCLLRWNKRTDRKAKAGWMLVILLSLLTCLITFIAGLMVGISSSV